MSYSGQFLNERWFSHFDFIGIKVAGTRRNPRHLNTRTDRGPVTVNVALVRAPVPTHGRKNRNAPDLNRAHETGIATDVGARPNLARTHDADRGTVRGRDRDQAGAHPETIPSPRGDEGARQGPGLDRP